MKLNQQTFEPHERLNVCRPNQSSFCYGPASNKLNIYPVYYIAASVRPLGEQNHVDFAPKIRDHLANTLILSSFLFP